MALCMIGSDDSLKALDHSIFEATYDIQGQRVKQAIASWVRSRVTIGDEAKSGQARAGGAS